MYVSYDLSQLRFVIVEQYQIIRGLYRSALHAFNIRRIQESSNFEGARNWVAYTNPDIVLIDWSVGFNGKAYPPASGKRRSRGPRFVPKYAIALIFSVVPAARSGIRTQIEYGAFGAAPNYHLAKQIPNCQSHKVVCFIS